MPARRLVATAMQKKFAVRRLDVSGCGVPVHAKRKNVGTIGVVHLPADFSS